MLNRWWLPEGGHLRIIPSPFSSIDLEGVELCLTAGGSRREHLRIISPPLSSNDLEGVELCLTAGGSRRGTPADYPVSLPLFQQPRRRWGNQKNVAGHVWFDPFGVGGREKRRLSAGVPLREPPAVKHSSTSSRLPSMRGKKDPDVRDPTSSRLPGMRSKKGPDAQGSIFLRLSVQAM